MGLIAVSLLTIGCSGIAFFGGYQHGVTHERARVATSAYLSVGECGMQKGGRLVKWPARPAPAVIHRGLFPSGFTVVCFEEDAP